MDKLELIEVLPNGHIVVETLTRRYKNICKDRRFLWWTWKEHRLEPQETREYFLYAAMKKCESILEHQGNSGYFKLIEEMTDGNGNFWLFTHWSWQL